MATMKDIANELNLSRCTVSNILNDKNKDKYRKETIDLVTSKAAELGYVPNNIAKSLKTGSTKVIALIVPDISSTFYIRIIKELEQLVHEANYSLMVCMTEEKLEKERRVLEMLKSQKVDGIIIAFVSYTKSKINESSYSVVTFDRIIKERNFPAVIIDDEKVGYDLTSKIIRAGSRNPIFIATYPEDYTIIYRIKGYKRALIENGITFSDENIIFNIYNETDAYLKFKELKSSNKIIFDGIISTSNYIFYGIIRALGQKMLDTIPYGGFYDFDGYSMFAEKIFCVKQPKQMAKIAFSKLFDIMENKNVEDTIIDVEID